MKNAKPKFNKTKLVATIGPASSDEKCLKQLILAGVDLFRVNFSHGEHASHLEVVQKIRKLNKAMGTHVAILGDLQGPKMRIGKVDTNGFELIKGAEVVLSTKICPADEIHVKFPTLAKDVKPGERVLLDDGKLELEFTEIVSATKVKAKVITGGILLSNKGFNLPSTDLTVDSLTAKDKKDLKFAMEHCFDWIALSFVREAKDIVKLRNILDKNKSTSNIVAKIEKPQAVANLDAIIEATDAIMIARSPLAIIMASDAIIEATDAIMIARGDLGVELPMEQVPMIQKNAVLKCNQASKPVIIATQMMESMIDSPTPTRAEANDVANAVMDGADAVMLSAETAIGSYPLEAVEAVERILRSTEEGWNIYNKAQVPEPSSPTFLSDEICYTAVTLGDTVGAKGIISMTQTGYTAYKIASCRPHCHIFIFTSNKQLLTQLSLVWNVKVYYYDKNSNTDETVRDVIRELKKQNWLQKDDIVLNTAAMPAMENRKTNTLRITRVR